MIIISSKLYHDEHWKPIKVLIDSQLTSRCLLVFPILAQSDSMLVLEKEKSKCTRGCAVCFAGTKLTERCQKVVIATFALYKRPGLQM